MNDRWNVYLIQCADNTLYCDVGRTQKALKKFKYLQSRAPHKVIWRKRCDRLSDAIGECLRVRSLKRVDKLKLV